MRETLKNDYDAIRPAVPDFRDRPVPLAFTWMQGILETPPEGLYLVAFRSQRRLDASPTDVARLIELDRAAYEDAQTQPGYLTYSHDDIVPNGKALSFCLWESDLAARAASRRSAHQAATKYVGVYEFYRLHRYHVVRKRLGELVFTPVQMHAA